MKGRFALILLVTGFAPASDADSNARIHTVDGRTIDGKLLALADGALKVEPEQDPPVEPMHISIFDVHRIEWSSPKFLQPPWRIELVNRDQIGGELYSLDADHLSIDAAVGADEPLRIEVPVTFVRRIWQVEKTQIDKLRPRAQAAAELDIALVRTNEKIQTVKGKIIGLAEKSLVFRFEDEVREIALDRVVGLVFAEATRAPDLEGFHHQFQLQYNAALSGAWIGWSEDASLTMKTAWGATLTFPPEVVARVDAQNGRLVYLSDLSPSAVEQTPFFDRVMPYRYDKSLTGKTLELGDDKYEKGIAVHARCVLSYQLDGEFAEFRATLGFEQPIGRLGRAAVRILGDERVLLEEPDARGDREPTVIKLKIQGVRKLTLEVGFGKEQDVGDRIIWADARLLRDRVSPG